MPRLRWLVNHEEEEWWCTCYHVSPRCRWGVHRNVIWEQTQPGRDVPSPRRRALYQVSHLSGWSSGLLRFSSLAHAVHTADVLCAVFGSRFAPPTPDLVDPFFETIHRANGRLIVAVTPPPVLTGITASECLRLRGGR